MTDKQSLKAIAAAVALAMASGSVLAAKVPAGVKLAAKQEFTRNTGAEPETLDPVVAESVPANTITADLFEGLTTLDVYGKVLPGVAESWKEVEANTWVFHLRKNAKWSDGTPVTAGDFVYGWQRFVDPKTASPYASTYGMFIVNGKEIAEGKKPASTLGVKAVDKYTLEVKTPYPVLFLPSLVANTQLAPLPKATIDKYGKDWTSRQDGQQWSVPAEGLASQQQDCHRQEPQLLGRQERPADQDHLSADRRQQRRRQTV